MPGKTSDGVLISVLGRYQTTKFILKTIGVSFALSLNNIILFLN